MKQLLLILGIVLTAAGGLCLLMGVFCLFAAMNTLDGSSSFYAKRFRLAFLFLAAGAVVLLAGIVCLICRKKYFLK